MVKEAIELLKDYGLEITLFIGGAFGAAMFSSKDENLTKTQRGVTIFFGGVTAVFVTPLAVAVINQVFKVSIGESIMPGAGFIIGYLGLETIKHAFKVYSNKTKK